MYPGAPRAVMRGGISSAYESLLFFQGPGLSELLYFDKDTMWHALVTVLHARGIDAQTALEAAMIERADEDHVAFATTRNRVLCSFNMAARSCGTPICSSCMRQLRG